MVVIQWVWVCLKSLSVLLYIYLFLNNKLLILLYSLYGETKAFFCLWCNTIIAMKPAWKFKRFLLTFSVKNEVQATNKNLKIMPTQTNATCKNLVTFEHQILLLFFAGSLSIIMTLYLYNNYVCSQQTREVDLYGTFYQLFSVLAFGARSLDLWSGIYLFCAVGEDNSLLFIKLFLVFLAAGHSSRAATSGSQTGDTLGKALASVSAQSYTRCNSNDHAVYCKIIKYWFQCLLCFGCRNWVFWCGLKSISNI